MQLPFTLQYYVALDMGSAWTRGASMDGRLSVTKSERHGLHGITAGEVVDVTTCSEIVSNLFKSLRPSFLGRPHAVACISSCASPAQRAAITSTLYQSGAWSVTLIQQPLAAAMGAGLDPSSDYAQMIIDVGDGFTEYSIIRAGRVEAAEAVKVGCANVRQVLAQHCRESEAGELLGWMQHGLFENEPDFLPDGVLQALGEPLSYLADRAEAFFKRLPDRVACEVIENGVVLVGGGAMLRELKRRISARSGLAVRVPDNPLMAVIEGAKQAIPYASMASRFHR